MNMVYRSRSILWLEGPIDSAVGTFVAERDFLVWMLYNNVSICDLGAETTGLLYKGEKHQRLSLPCSMGRSTDGSQPI